MPDPYPFYPSMRQRDVDLSGLGPDMAEEYTGDSMEDFYDYLLTPRNQRQRSQQGAITHYGPSRFASVSPENAGMAQMIMQLMEGEDIREFNQTTRESDMARRAAADEMMMPQGRGGGQVTFTGGAGAGSQEPTRFGAPAAGGPGWAQGMATPQGIQIGGGIPQGPPPAPGPVSDRDRMLAAAGGVGGADESRVAAAASQGLGYPGPTRKPATPTQVAAAERDVMIAESALLQSATLEEDWKGKSSMEMLEAYMADKSSVPWGMRESLGEFAARFGYYQNLRSGPAPGADYEFE